VVDVDWFVEDDYPRYQLDVNREKAALHGISVQLIASTLDMALGAVERSGCCTSPASVRMCR
jgi:multidrug efflux pump subunit AcrB